MLQGSLDNFALDEVLGLLSSTAKTGKLEVKGDRGAGALSLRQGQLVAATATNTANGIGTEDIVFELMRFAEGSFVFTPGEVDSTEPGRQVPEVLASAENRLADWRTIEAVVPSLNHTVSPVPALPADEITIDRREWSTLIVIGSGCPVAAVCTELDLGEVEGSRQIKNLADRGLVSVGPPLNKTGATYVARSATAPGPVDPLSRPAADPFARRAEQASIRRVETQGAPAAAETAEVPASAMARELAGASAAARPPMPAPPTAAELRSVDGPATNGRASIASVLDAPAAPAPAPEASKPGGLLMRYLKGED